MASLPLKSPLQLLSPSSATPANDDVEWLPLQSDPIFSGTVRTSNNITSGKQNLIASDGSSRLYYWDITSQTLHRIALLFAASPSKVLRADVELSFTVDRITINRNGSALLLEGSYRLHVSTSPISIGRFLSKDTALICRKVSVGSYLYFNTNNAVRTLKVPWPP